jgi:ABC-type branched-subunit amino acid transport system ATPase component
MAVLEAESISKSFGGVAALWEVDIEAGEGEIVGLIGPNGAGKTTLFNCLLGLERPDRGRVVFDGQVLDGVPIHRRARLGIGRTFQRMELFAEMTARDHLMAAARVHDRGGLLLDLCNKGAPSAEDRSKVDEILDLLGIADIADRPAESLSLGHGRLVELGRALATEPRLLMLDEPSSGLDRVETAGLADVLVRVVEARGIGVLLVEHDLELVRHITSRLYVLELGRLLISGPTARVLDDTEVRRAYLGETADTPEVSAGHQAPAAVGPTLSGPAISVREPAPATARSSDGMTSGSAPLLELEGVEAAYGPFRALFGVSFSVPQGSAVALLGPNGAGKSTVARVATGLVPLTSGRICFDGRDVTGLRPHRLARRGMVHVAEGRSVFSTLSVAENLGIHFRRARGRASVAESFERSYEAFPILHQRRHQRAGTLSGGEQRMLALAAVLANPPKMLVVDELSLGLAPRLIDDVYQSLETIHQAGTSLLIVEQHVARALALAEYYVLLGKGEVVRQGRAEHVEEVIAYLPGESADPS